MCVYVFGSYACMFVCMSQLFMHTRATLARFRCPSFQYPVEKPLLFNICVDPSEGIPLAGALPSGSVLLLLPGAKLVQYTEN